MKQIKFLYVRKGMCIKGLDGFHIGLVIDICTDGTRDSKFWEGRPWIHMLDGRDCYHGGGISEIKNIEDKVEVLEGTQKKEMLDGMKKEMEESVKNRQENLEFIISSMDK